MIGDDGVVCSYLDDHLLWQVVSGARSLQFGWVGAVFGTSSTVVATNWVGSGEMGWVDSEKHRGHIAFLQGMAQAFCCFGVGEEGKPWLVWYCLMISPAGVEQLFGLDLRVLVKSVCV